MNYTGFCPVFFCISRTILLSEIQLTFSLSKLHVISSEMDVSSQEKDLVRQKSADEKEKGNKNFNSGHFKEAIHHYTNAIRIDPSEPTILSNRAMAYLKLNEFAKAKIDCDLAIALNPGYVKAIYRRAMAYLGMNDKDAAQKNFRRVLELEPSNRLAMDELKKLESILTGKNTDQNLESGRKKLDGHQMNEKTPKPKDDPLLVSPILDPPESWLAQSMTRITEIQEIQEISSSIAHISISNGVDSSVADSKASNASSPTSPMQEILLPTVDLMEVPPVPQTSVEFFSRWGTLRRRNLLEVFQTYFMNIPLESYGDLFGCLIDSDILSDIIGAFKHAVHEDPTIPVSMAEDNVHHQQSSPYSNSNSDQDSTGLRDLKVKFTVVSVAKRLLRLSQLDRFQVAYMFLEDVDKQAVKDIIGDLEKSGQGDLANLASSLKMAFSM